MKRRTKKIISKKKRRLIISFIIGLIILVAIGLNFNKLNVFKYRSLVKMYVASDQAKVSLYNDQFEEVGKIVRGQQVDVYKKTIINDKITYQTIKYQKKIYYLKKDNLVSEKKDVIKEQYLFVRTPTIIYRDLEEGTIEGVALKGTKWEVMAFNFIDDEGYVDAYQVKNDSYQGHIYGKYIVLDEEDSLAHYEVEKYYQVHQQRGNRYSGGDAGNLDYYPVIKPVFDDNLMPEKVYALYLNSGRNVISNVDAYIDYAKTTKINAFVVDIKDNESPAYKSKVFEQYSPTNYKYANNTFENYQTAIKKLRAAGFYVIGRITVFKDKYYVLDNEDIAILDSRNNKPYLHSNTYWPSPYQRKVWEFNVALAKEAVKEMDFNEIQFDYVRFPDRTISAEKEGLMLLGNNYNEEKAAAIQGFFRYAVDELHKLNTYVSADLFGESAYTYVTAYGQYWPAISNVVDVVSGMPYPDHFNKYEFGFKEPVWTVPYELVYHWASNYVVKRQTEIPSPAIVRTWIQTYDVPDYKHKGGFEYGVKEIKGQIQALFDAGLDGGYMTWLSYSSLERYKNQVDVYSKEY